jgi:hypothetical protein
MVQETEEMRRRRGESFMVVDGRVRVGLGYGNMYIYIHGGRRERRGGGYGDSQHRDALG